MSFTSHVGNTAGLSSFIRHCDSTDMTLRQVAVYCQLSLALNVLISNYVD